MTIAILSGMALSGAIAAMPPRVPEAVYGARPKVFESADAAAGSYLDAMPNAFKQYRGLRLSAETHRGNAKVNVAKLSEASSDAGLRTFLHGLVSEHDAIRVPVLVESVAVGNRKLWAVVVAWEIEATNGPPVFTVGHIAAYIIEAGTGKQLASRACG